jgi:hypothetical protein
VRGQWCGALTAGLDDVDFSLVTGHGYDDSGMTLWHTRGSPGGLRHDRAATVGGNVRHRGAARS